MIELRAVRKSYGSTIALDGLSMHVPEKAVYGLVGPAGSGKSSVMELLAGLSRPDEGEILVDGLREGSERRRWKRRIGYMPDFSGLYPEMRLSEYLEFFSACYDIPRARARQRIGILLDQVGLRGKEFQRLDGLSRGMRQKLSLARVLLHDPKILVLDEPLKDLDPGNRYELRQILSELSSEGKTILLSSEMLTSISEICTDIGIIERGRMALEGKLSEVLRKIDASNPILILVEGSITKTMQILKQDPNVKSIGIREQELMILYEGSEGEEAELLRRLVSSGIMVRSFHRERGNLELLFLQLTGELRERRITGHEAESDLSKG